MRFEDLAQQYINSDKERKRLGLDENAFAIYVVFEPLADKFSSAQAKEIDAIFKEFPDYDWDEAQERKLRAKLYKPIRSLIGTSKMTEVVRCSIEVTADMTASGCWQDADELKWAVRSWEARIGVKVSQIYLRKMSQKWASISTSGRLTLNSELLELPKELGEFVIVHEILHIIAPNHGKVLKASCLHISQIGVRGKSSYRAVKMERIRSRPI